MTNYEMIQQATREIFKAETPEQVELYTKFITFLLMG